MTKRRPHKRQVPCPASGSFEIFAYQRTNSANTRAYKRGAPGVLTYRHICDIFEQQHGRCFYCGRDVEEYYHIDHLVPLSKGGPNIPENIAIACGHCNGMKRDRSLREFFGMRIAAYFDTVRSRSARAASPEGAER